MANLNYMKRAILLISAAMVLFIFAHTYTMSPPSLAEYLLFGVSVSLPYIILWLLARYSLKGKIDMIAAFTVILIFSLIDILGIAGLSFGIFIMPMDKLIVVVVLLMILLPLGKLLFEKNIGN